MKQSLKLLDGLNIKEDKKLESLLDEIMESYEGKVNVKDDLFEFKDALMNVFKNYYKECDDDLEDNIYEILTGDNFFDNTIENETLHVLETRRSCRNFKSDMISKEEIDAVIKAGTFAPTGMGRQSPIIIAVTDKELRDKISEENRKIGGWKEGFDPFYNAPVILIVLANKNMPTYKYDGSLIMGNLLNAAHSIGLGSIWIHRAKEEFESEFGKNILKQLGIEGDYEGIGHCALGYYNEEVPAIPRKDNYVYYID